jgi:hypothetical protein
MSRRRKGLSTAAGWGEREFRRSALVTGVLAIFSAVLLIPEFEDAGETHQQLVQEKCGNVEAGEYGGNNLLDSAFNCLVQHGLARQPTEEEMQKAAKLVRKAMEETEPPSSGVTLYAYDLMKNPFRYRNSTVVLDVVSRPVLFSGSVVQYAGGVDPRVAAQFGLLGMRFNRMVSEDTGLYAVMGIDASANSDAKMLGQLAVVTHGNELDLGRYWEVEPLGTTEGTNALGAVLSVPVVRFWRYTDEEPRRP